MIAFPNAKLNFGLNITSKRSDGYHNIASVFLPIAWRDALEVVPSDQFEFSSSGLDIPGDYNNNLCVKAYELLKADFDIPSVKMHLHKVIPMGAGLGGGSADGSFSLKLINELFSLQLTNDKLETYAKKLGADCPFFIQNSVKYVTGIGDLMTDIEVDLSGLFLVVICPNIHVSTAVAFSGITPENPLYHLPDSVGKSRERWQQEIKNDFDLSVLVAHPEIADIKADMIAKGAMYASMTGTGSAVYAFFDQAPTDIDFPNCSVWSQSM